MLLVYPCILQNYYEKKKKKKSWNMTISYPLWNVSEPLPPVYGSVDENDEKLMINVNVSYATVAEREDKLGQTSDIYDDVNMRQ